MFRLEAKPDLRINAAVVSRIAGTEPTKSTASLCGLPKQLRSEVTDRISEVRVVQQVVEVQ